MGKQEGDISGGPRKSEVWYWVAAGAVFVTSLAVPAVAALCFGSSFKDWQALLAAGTTLSAGIIAFAGATRQARMAREDADRPLVKASQAMAQAMLDEFNESEKLFKGTWVANRIGRGHSENEGLFRKTFDAFLGQWELIGYMGELPNEVRTLYRAAAELDQKVLNPQIGDLRNGDLTSALETVLDFMHKVRVRLEECSGAYQIAAETSERGPITLQDLGYT